MSFCRNIQASPPKPIERKYPCPCLKCRNKRIEAAKKDAATQNASTQDAATQDAARTDAVDPVNVATVCCLTEAISFLAFLIITVGIIWFAVLRYVIRLGYKVYKSDSNTQIGVAVLIGLLFLSASLNVLFLHCKRPPNTRVLPEKRACERHWMKFGKCVPNKMEQPKKALVKRDHSFCGKRPEVKQVKQPSSWFSSLFRNWNKGRKTIAKHPFLPKALVSATKQAKTEQLIKRSGHPLVVRRRSFCGNSKSVEKSNCLARLYESCRKRLQTCWRPAKVDTDSNKKKEKSCPLMDDTANDGLRHTKMFSMPLEMKRPPTVLVYLYQFLFES